MTKPIDFEKALEQLEAVVAKMETGDLPLAETMKEFEAGVKLVRQCQTQLEQARQQVDQLIASQEANEESDEMSN